MTHGKKFLSMRNRKFIGIIFVGLTIAILAITKARGLLTTLRNENYTDTTKLSHILQRKRFITVQEQDYAANFDLKTKEYFSDGMAIKSDELFGASAWKASDVYPRKVLNYFTSAIWQSDITLGDIKDSNRQITKDIEDVINKSYLSQTNPPSLEEAYVYGNAKKVRITFNKNYLPTELELNYGGNAWETFRTYSYPYDNKEEFDKALDEAIEWIKISESEMEED